MEWYGKEHLQPKYTRKLVLKWQSPPNNCAAHYYSEFPELYPKYLPEDHPTVHYDEKNYPKHRDYSTFKSAPEKIPSSHRIEWEDGYGPCNVCNVCIKTKKLNDERMADYMKRLAAWRENGTPM